MVKRWVLWWAPIFLILMIAPFTPWLDLTIAHLFYQKTGKGHFMSNPLLDFIFDYAILPAQFTAFAAAAVFLFSFCFSFWKKWRLLSLFLVLNMALGAGLITHLLLKDHWGRPRPRQIVEFGGIQTFRPFYRPNFFEQPEPSKSFPCGHCTMGFYFFAFILIGKQLKNRSLFYWGIGLSFGLGVALSVARLAQGGHFLSDVLFSALIMWLTALFCHSLCFSKNYKKINPNAKKSRSRIS